MKYLFHIKYVHLFKDIIILMTFILAIYVWHKIGDFTGSEWERGRFLFIPKWEVLRTRQGIIFHLLA